MKASWTAGLLLLLSWSLPALDPPLHPSDPIAVSDWLEGLGNRREGSAAEKAVFDALDSWFAGRTNLQRNGFAGRDGEHSFSQQLWFRIPGRLPGEFVIVAPTDGPNHRGLGWAAAWADQALLAAPPVSLTFLFTGAERGPGATAGLGSRAFLQDFYPTDPAAVLYLDTIAGDEVRLTTESGIYPSPLWMVQGLSVALGPLNLVPRFTGANPSLFRLDLPGRRNALAPWFDRSIPGLLVSSGPPGPALVEALSAFCADLPGGIPASWDRHYLMFDFGAWKVFWGQGFYLALFLAVAAILLFGYATLSRRRRGSLRTLVREGWQLPVLLAFGFLALSTGTVLAAALQTARGEPDLWQRLPLLVWTFKALVTLSLFLVLFLPFRRSPLSRDPDFYGQAALVWLALTTLGAAAVELSFSFYFLWALVWAATLVLVPWRPWKTLALAAGPVWLFKAAYDILGPNPDVDLSRWVLASPLAGNFLLTVLFFPFLLQVAAWHFSGRRHQDWNESLRAGLQIAAWGLAAVAVGLVILRIEPTDKPTPPSPTRTLDLTAGAASDGLWTTTVDRTAFLDRTVWNLTFDGSTPPEEVELVLVSRQALVVYDSTFPVVLDPEGHQARIVVGRQTPLPLKLRLTLPQSTSAQLRVGVSIRDPVRYEIKDQVDLGP